MIGQKIADRYRINEVIGVGGFGKIYKGIDLRDNLTVAIKQLNQHLADYEHIERFKREGEALRELNHPNIVKMLDAIQDGDDHFLIMEYVSGGDLDDLLKQGTIPLEQTLTYAIDLADALTRAHKLNIIHRDLKPANVLIGDDGVLRLTDFGVSRIGGKDKITETGAPMGTFAYMAPEVFNSDWIDARADVWAFGVMLFEMIVGELPFQGNSITQLIMSITANDLPDIKMLAPHVPPSLVKLLERMLEKDRSKRIASVRYVGAHLEDILHGRGVPETESTEPLLVMPTRKRHNLPTPTTPFVGRASEIDEVTRLIDEPSHRLITVLAPGGMGKTRLAIAVAKQYIDLFNDGVFFVSLQALSNPDNIALEIASSVNFPLQHGDARQQVLNFLSNKEMLLVFDNFEHLLDGASILADILSDAPEVTMLITSRERLHLSAETVYSLPEMACPMSMFEDILNFDAVRLLIQTAQHVKSDWELIENNLEDVFRVTELTQGSPLGILLAMSWLDMMPISKIVDEIQRDIDFLSADLRDLPDRHQSIRAIFNGTWQRLSENEQSVFMKMSIFRGGFTREAVQTVTDANVRIIHSLTNKALIQVDDSGRYNIHELLRQFAEEMLNASDEVTGVRDAHCHYYLGLVGEMTAIMNSEQTMALIHIIDPEFENIKIAWHFAFDNAHYELLADAVFTLSFYAIWANKVPQTSQIFNHAIAVIENEKLHQPEVQRFYGYLLLTVALYGYAALVVDSKKVLQQLITAVEIFRGQSDVFGLGYAIFELCRWYRRIGEPEKTLALLDEAQSLFSELNNQYWVIACLSGKAIARQQLGGSIRSYVNDRLKINDMSKGIAFDGIIAMSNGWIGEAFINLGDYEQAKAYYQKAVDLQNPLGIQTNINWMLYELGLVLRIQGDYERSKQVTFEGMKMCELSQAHAQQSHGALYLANNAALMGNYDEALTLVEQAKHINPHINQIRVEVTLGDIHVWMRKFDEACQYYQSIIDRHDGKPSVYNTLLGHTLAVTDQIEDAQYHLIEGLKVTLPREFRQVYPHAILGFAEIFARQEQWTRAIELATLVKDSEVTHAQFKVFAQELLESLQSNVSADLFQEAVEQGKTLDLDETAKAILQEFTAIYGE